MNAIRARAARRRLDAKLAPLRPAERLIPPPRGWTRAIRDALGMSQADLARRLGVSTQAVSQLEAGEADGSVRLATLRRAAEAMGCTLVYALVPKTGLEEVVTTQAARVAGGEIAAAERSMALEDQAASLPDAARHDLVDRLIASRRLWRA